MINQMLNSILSEMPYNLQYKFVPKHLKYAGAVMKPVQYRLVPLILAKVYQPQTYDINAPVWPKWSLLPVSRDVTQPRQLGGISFFLFLRCTFGATSTPVSIGQVKGGEFRKTRNKNKQNLCVRRQEIEVGTPIFTRNHINSIILINGCL